MSAGPFARLPLRTRLLLVAVVALAAVAIAGVGARLLEPKPFGSDATFYALTAVGPGGSRVGGPFLVTLPIVGDEAPRVVLEIDAAARGLPDGLRLEAISPSGRFALLAAGPEPTWADPGPAGMRFVADITVGSILPMPTSMGASWAPTVDRLAWWSHDGRSTSIGVFDPVTGTSRGLVPTGQLTVGALDGAGLADAPYWLDGDTLLVFDWWHATSWRLPVAGDGAVPTEYAGEARWISEQSRDLSVSRDRTLVAYMVTEWPEPAPVPDGEDAPVRQVVVDVLVHAPDGANTRHLATYVAHLEGPIAPDWFSFDHAVWSADSRTFSWTAEGQIYLAGVDGPEFARYDLPAFLAPDPDGVSPSFTWRLP